MRNIWIGDFRCRDISKLNPKDCEFIFEEMATQSWVATSASYELIQKAPAQSNIIFMLGIWDCIYSCIWNSLDAKKTALAYAKTVNELLSKYPGNVFYVCAVPPVFGDFSSSFTDTGIIAKKTLNEKIKTYNEELKSSCLANFLDIHKYIQDTSATTLDGLHYDKTTTEAIYNFISSNLTVEETAGASSSISGFKTRVDSNDKFIYEGCSTSAYWFSNNPFYKAGYGMPNCTTYAWGRFYEIYGKPPALSTRDAERWYEHNDGYSRGHIPQEGAVICWRHGEVGDDPDITNSDSGHVAIVERLIKTAEGDITAIIISESGYGWGSDKYNLTDKFARVKKISKGTTSGKEAEDSTLWKYANDYYFQGFIYNPKFDVAPPVVKAAPTVFDANSLKLDALSATSVTASLICRNAISGSYTLSDAGTSKVLATKDLKVKSELPIGTVITFSIADLTPNTKYTLKVSVKGEEASDKKELLISFTTPQSRPASVKNLKIEHVNGKFDEPEIKVSFSPADSFGYWSKNNYGYEIVLLINGQEQKAITDKTFSTNTTININSYFNYKNKFGNNLQIGLRTYTVDDAGNKIYDYEKPAIVASNAICMPNRTIKTFLNC